MKSRPETGPESAIGWQPELDELREREEFARRLGGADKVKRQHDAGKLTIRERIDGLVDRGSFHEVGAIAGRAEYDEHGRLVELVPSNCVMGRAWIDGRAVVIVGDDFTVRGGSADATIREKPLMAEQMAHDLRLPIVRIIEGSGGGGSVKTIETTGRANLPGRVGSNLPYYYTTTNMGLVPVVALGLGSVAGLGAARMAASHYSIMTKESSALFVAGPPVVNALTPDRAKHLDRFQLGGWEIQTRCGAVDHAVDTEEEAFSCMRRFLSYLPSSVFEVAPRGPRTDDPERREEFLFDAIPRDRRKVYRMRPIVEAVVDKGSFFEMGRMFGRGIITGLARLDGLPVAIMASDPFFYAGAWTADVCDKIIRFVDLADTFHLPIVYLCDCPGFRYRAGGREGGDDPQGRARDGGGQPVERAVVHLPGAQRVRRRRRGQPALGPVFDPLCLAVGALGVIAVGGRHRGRLSRRDRRRPGPRRENRRDRGAAEPAALAVPHRRKFLDRGDHRPARHAPARGRVRQSGRKAARTRRAPLRHAALIA